MYWEQSSFDLPSRDGAAGVGAGTDWTQSQWSRLKITCLNPGGRRLSLAKLSDRQLSPDRSNYSVGAASDSEARVAFRVKLTVLCEVQ